MGEHSHAHDPQTCHRGITRSGFTVTPDADTPPVNMIPGVREGHPVGGPKAVPATKLDPRTTAIDDKTGSSDEQYTEHAKNFLECKRNGLFARCARPIAE